MFLSGKKAAEVALKILKKKMMWVDDDFTPGYSM
jgi:hypothetical protein